MKKSKEEWENPFIYNPYKKKKKKKPPFTVPPLSDKKELDEDNDSKYQYYTLGDFFKRKFFK